MKKVQLSPLHLNGEWQIAIKFKFDSEIEKLLQALRPVKWSDAHSCFYAALCNENKHLLYHKLRASNLFVDYKEMQEFSPQKRKVETSTVEFSRNQKKILHEYVAYLRGQRLSASSVRTYYSFIFKLVDHLGEKPLASLSHRDIQLFVEQRIAGGNYALSTHRQCISAIKHFVELFGCERIDAAAIKRPKRSQYLPSVLSKEEVISLLQATFYLFPRDLFC
jgi:hypothetical protein